jgi:hypothetical protein
MVIFALLGALLLLIVVAMVGALTPGKPPRNNS